MPNTMQKFESKRDLWLMAVLWSAVVELVWSIFRVWQDAPLAMAASFAVVMLVIAALTLWVMYGTFYLVDESTLIVRSGPFRYRVRLADIVAVTPSNSPLSSPAMSLDRLKISYGSPQKDLLVSPKDRAGFLKGVTYSSGVTAAMS
jgi:hypothetical protein